MVFAMSSWSVDGLLSSGFPLVDLPAAARDNGLGVLELCHFHLPTTEPGYLDDLRANLTASGTKLFSLLIDTGDVASPDPDVLGESLGTIQRYIRVAARLGAERVRVSAGLQPPTPETLAQSAAQLGELMTYAAAHGLGLSTENWQRTAHEPEDVLTILGAVPAGFGLCVDTGNAEGTLDKYRTLAQLLPHATSVHFKARTAGGATNQEATDRKATDQYDVRRCLELLNAASFNGPVSLIYDGKRDEWAGIAASRAALVEAARANAV